MIGALIRDPELFAAVMALAILVSGAYYAIWNLWNEKKEP